MAIATAAKISTVKVNPLKRLLYLDAIVKKIKKKMVNSPNNRKFPDNQSAIKIKKQVIALYILNFRILFISKFLGILLRY